MTLKEHTDKDSGQRLFPIKKKKPLPIGFP
jgi:hypothetical protein